MAFVAAAVVSVVLERAFYRRLYRASDLDQVLLTIGLAFISVAVAAYIFGTHATAGRDAGICCAARSTFLGLGLGNYRLFLVGIALVVTMLLVAGLEYTRFGAQVRAAVDNQRMARGLGIDVDRTFAVTFALGSGLAGLGGALAIEIVGLDPNFAFTYLVYVLIIVSVGGLGSIAGSFAAAMPDRRQRRRRQILRARARRLPDLSGHGGGADVAPRRPVREALDVAARNRVSHPQAYLQAQSRWHPLEIAFWLATLLPFVLFPDYLSLASQIAITALFALSLDLILGYAGIVSLGHAAFFGIGAYTAGLFSKFVLGRAGDRARLVAAAVAGIVGFAIELHHRALPPFHADHDHARPRPAGLRSGQPRALAHRRQRRLAGRHRSGRCSASSSSISTATPPTPIRWSCCSWCSSARGG